MTAVKAPLAVLFAALAVVALAAACGASATPTPSPETLPIQPSTDAVAPDAGDATATSAAGSSKEIPEATTAANPGPSPVPAQSGSQTSSENRSAEEQDFEILTSVPKDAIPAILYPVFVTAEQARQQFPARETVLGVSINGDHRAYFVSQLSSHEIVNDVVGGVPVAVTW